MWEIVYGTETLDENANEGERRKSTKRENQALALVCLSMSTSCSSMFALPIQLRMLGLARRSILSRNHCRKKSMSEEIVLLTVGERRERDRSH